MSIKYLALLGIKIWSVLKVLNEAIPHPLHRTNRDILKNRAVDEPEILLSPCESAESF